MKKWKWQYYLQDYWKHLDHISMRNNAHLMFVFLGHSYFLLTKQKLSVEKEEELMHTVEFGSFCMAHNGWVMNDDPMRNFAEPGMSSILVRDATNTLLTVI